MASPQPARTRAFISYSHADRPYLERLQRHLKPLLREGDLQVWDDTQIQPGSNWREEIEQALASARVAILLVSAHFLTSDFVAREELPKLLAAAKNEGARILPVILSPSVFRRTKLSQFQAVNDPVRPLNSMLEYEQDEVWVQLAELVYEVLCTPLPIGTKLLTYSRHSAPIEDILWSPDNRCIASSCREHCVDVWNAVTGQCLETHDIAVGNLVGIAWLSHRLCLISGNHEGMGGMWDVVTGQELFEYQILADWVHAIEWSPDSEYFAALLTYLTMVSGEERRGEIRKAHTGELVEHIGEYNDIYGVSSWSPDSRFVATWGSEAKIAVWDASTGVRTCAFYGHTADNDRHPDDVQAVTWSSDSKRMASGGKDGSVHIWDTRTGQMIFTYTGHTAAVTALAWSPDACRLASASNEQVQVWDAANGKHLFTYKGHDDKVNAVAWSPDGTRLASGGADHTVQVWSAGKQDSQDRAEAGLLYPR